MSLCSLFSLARILTEAGSIEVDDNHLHPSEPIDINQGAPDTVEFNYKREVTEVLVIDHAADRGYNQLDLAFRGKSSGTVNKGEGTGRITRAKAVGDEGGANGRYCQVMIFDEDGDGFLSNEKVAPGINECDEECVGNSGFGRKRGRVDSEVESESVIDRKKKVKEYNSSNDQGEVVSRLLSSSASATAERDNHPEVFVLGLGVFGIGGSGTRKILQATSSRKSEPEKDLNCPQREDGSCCGHNKGLEGESRDAPNNEECSEPGGVAMTRKINETESGAGVIQMKKENEKDLDGHLPVTPEVLRSTSSRKSEHEKDLGSEQSKDVIVGNGTNTAQMCEMMDSEVKEKDELRKELDHPSDRITLEEAKEDGQESQITAKCREEQTGKDRTDFDGDKDCQLTYIRKEYEVDDGREKTKKDGGKKSGRVLLLDVECTGALVNKEKQLKRKRGKPLMGLLKGETDTLRKRGRPPKGWLKEETDTPRKRGRPFKVSRSSNVNKIRLKYEERVETDKPRGRPKKLRLTDDDCSDVVVKEVEKEKNNESPKRGRARPPKVCKSDVSGSIKVKQGKKEQLHVRSCEGAALVHVGKGLGVKISDVQKPSKSNEADEELEQEKVKPTAGDSGARRLEKQLVRDKIVEMLLSAGWTIDYRPRNGRDYNDAVYVNPDGRTHWSVTLAYRMLKDHYDNSGGDSASCKPGFKFTPLSDEEIEVLRRVVGKVRIFLQGSGTVYTVAANFVVKRVKKILQLCSHYFNVACARNHVLVYLSSFYHYLYALSSTYAHQVL
ncbi:hypothetical protein LINGRAHAP2_LOCUS1404 [Linum grandiflorum]